MCTHYEKCARPRVLLRVACVYTLPILDRSVQKGGKGIVYRYKPMKAIKQRSEECFVVSDFFY